MKGQMAIFRTLVCIALLFAAQITLGAANVTEERVVKEAASGEHWFLKGGNFRGEHFSPLAEVSDHNVHNLGLAWSSTIPAPDGIAATPIVVDGVIYFSVAYSVVFAVDAANGHIIWQYHPDMKSAYVAGDRLTSVYARANRGVAVWHGKVLVATADCRLIALDAKSGKELWSTKTCDPALGYGISDSPYVGGNKVFVGNAGNESGKKNRGYVSAYDVETGEMLWRFYTVPSADPAQNTSPAMKMAAKTWSGDALEKFAGGASNWNEMTYDPQTGLLFFGTAGGLPRIHEQRSPDGGDTLFTQSLLAVDADTGEYVWHYQTVPKDSWDYNVTMNIVLADLKIGGTPRETVLIAPKNGFQYVLDRRTGELLKVGQFAKVNWATHIDLETGRPVYSPEAEYWKREPGVETAFWPSLWGAHSWQPMAWHDGHGLLYIPVMEFADIRTKDEYRLSRVFTEVDGEPFSPGKLLAWDPVKQSPRWTVNHKLPLNGGVLATAGNLVFQGDAQGQFTAYRADTGEKLWSVPTGSSIGAAPVSYAIAGRQYVLVPVGYGGALQFFYPDMAGVDKPQGPTRLLAFTLDGQAKPDLQQFQVRRQLPTQPKLEATPEFIATGKNAYRDNTCYVCHGKDAVVRHGGSVPDLRYADSQTHATWHGIVIGGALSHKGMPRFPMSADVAEAIRNYVLSRSMELRICD